MLKTGLEEHQLPFIGAYLLLFQGEKILLQRRSDPYLNGCYSLVAGHVEKGETIPEAMAREAQEEANLLLDPQRLSVKLAVQRPCSSYRGGVADVIDFFVLATEFQGTLRNNEPDKCSELGFYELAHLPDRILPHVRLAIQGYLQQQTYLIYREAL